MNDLMKNLKEAYDLLRTIPVSDQHVDAMYVAKLKLQTAYRLADQKEEVPPDGSGT